MISDVLFDAIADIEDYQKKQPEAYDGVKDDIETVKEAMLGLVRKLDAVPLPILTAAEAIMQNGEVERESEISIACGDGVKLILPLAVQVTDLSGGGR
ncbi:MAG: hypothetical protein WCA27_07285 [Candidatus Sulfotelmatobacter sp.]